MPILLFEPRTLVRGGVSVAAPRVVAFETGSSSIRKPPTKLVARGSGTKPAQLRAQRKVRKPAQHLDLNFAAVGYPMKQCGSSPTDVGHCHNPLFIPVTVTETSASGTLADVSWPRAMWSFA